MTAVQYIGSKISLISKSDIRYEGILYTIDPVECTIALAKVKSMGTEDRPTDRPVPARSEVYEYIVFRGSDIRDIRVCQPPKPQPVLAGGLPNDPAILQHSLPNGAASAQTGDSTSTAGTESSLGSFMSGIKQKAETGSTSIGQPAPALLPLCTSNPTADNTSTERAVQVDRQRNASSSRARTSQSGTPQRGHRRNDGLQHQGRQQSGQRDCNYIPTHHPGGFQQNRPYFYRDQRGFNDDYHVDHRAQYNLTPDGYIDRRYNNAGFRGNRGGLMNRQRDFQDRRMQNGFVGRQNYLEYYANNHSYRNYNDSARQYGQNYQGYNPNYSGARGGGGGGGGGCGGGVAGGQRRNSRQMSVNQDSDSSGGRRITFNEDYDFETANIEFENLKDKLSEMKIDNTDLAAVDNVAAAAIAAAEKTTEKECEEKAKKEDQGDKSEDENLAINLNSPVQKETDSAKKCYDPTISFFDNLSNVPPKTSNMDRSRAMKLNLETFGERGRMRGRRAAINTYGQQPRVANYGGFRGDFLYANNFRSFNNPFYNPRFRGYPNRLGGGGGQMEFRNNRFTPLPAGGLFRRNRRF